MMYYDDYYWLLENKDEKGSGEENQQEKLEKLKKSVEEAVSKACDKVKEKYKDDKCRTMIAVAIKSALLTKVGVKFNSNKVNDKMTVAEILKLVVEENKSFISSNAKADVDSDCGTLTDDQLTATINSILDEVVNLASKDGNLLTRIFEFIARNPKDMIKDVWNLIKRIPSAAKENKGKTAAIISAIIVVAVVLRILSKRFPIIGKIFAPFIWIIKAPFRVIKWLINKFSKKPTEIVGTNIGSEVTGLDQDNNQVPAILVIYEQYVSNPTFRRAYDSLTRNLNMYIIMYSVV